MPFFALFISVLSPRIDYVLETSMVEYFSAITSHQSYWQNQDFAKFVLNRIFSEEDEHDTDSTDDRKASWKISQASDSFHSWKVGSGPVKSSIFV